MSITRFSRLLLTICLVSLLLMFVGCWGSKYTLINQDQAKVDRAYIGNWSAVNSKGESSSLIIRNIDEKMFYVETREGAKQYPEGITRYIGFLAPVKGAMFAHLKQLQDNGDVQEDWLAMRLELTGERLVIRQLKDEYMKEKNITSAEQLRKVIEQNLEEGSMYDKEEVVTATRLPAN